MRIGTFKFFEKLIIGDIIDGTPLLTRWILFRCYWFGVFFHTFHRSDHDRALHDHPWPFVTVILKNGYYEEHDQTDDGHKLTEYQISGSILYRPALWRHRVILDQGKPSYSLVFVGPRIRHWGFHTPNGWCWWRQYNSDTAMCEENIIHHGGKD